MFHDIVFPEGNEEKFIETAERLSFEGLVFAYKFEKKKAEFFRKKIESLQKKTDVRLNVVFEAEDAKTHQIRSMGEKSISKADRNPREIMAKHQPCMAYGLELSEEKDFAKARNSGLDRPICQFAKKNDVAMVFSFSSVLETDKPEELLGRMRQNVKLCRKYQLTTIIASLAKRPEQMRNPHDIRSFFFILGMHPSDSKKSIEAVARLFRKV